MFAQLLSGELETLKPDSERRTAEVIRHPVVQWECGLEGDNSSFALRARTLQWGAYVSHPGCDQGRQRLVSGRNPWPRAMLWFAVESEPLSF